MATGRTCSKCGSQQAGDSLGGLCPACVGLVAFEAFSLEGMEFGDYRILEEIARGGMGVVYKARQISLDRVVAVKMILAGSFAGEKEAQRFRAEAQIAARLRHPNIVAVYEIGFNEGRQFFSMEYVEGQNLAQLAKGNPLAPAQAAQHLKTIAEAIHYAHQQGILHRDLKPSNVLVDLSGRLHITDFGVAKRFEADSDLTETGQVMGTPAFMPPEQAFGKRGETGAHSDIYSLGALLYFLLTGEAPFSGESVHETIVAVLHQEARSPRALNPEVPIDLETICRKCLEKDPRRRYATAQELAYELGRFLRHEPILARPTGPLDRFARWCRRSPTTASLLISLLVTLAALIAFMTETRQGPSGLRTAVDAHRQHSTADQSNSMIVEIDASNLSTNILGPGRAPAVDAKHDRLWIPTLYSGGVTVRDGQTEAVLTNITLDGCPGDIAIDPVRSIAWVTAQCGHGNDTIWAINSDTFAILAGPIHCGGVTGGNSAVNPATGRFYYPAGETCQRLDPADYVLKTNAFQGVVAVNPIANLIYARPSATTLQIIDGSTDPETVRASILLQFTQGAGRCGVDPALNLLYVPNPGSATILVLDGRTGQTTNVLTVEAKIGGVDSVKGVAVDPDRHLLYAVATTPSSAGGLYVLDPTKDGAKQDAVSIPADSAGPVYNPSHHKIYIWTSQLAGASQ